MKTAIPTKLTYQEKLALAALRNYYMARRADADGKLVRIGRAQGYEEALGLMLGGKEAAREMMSRMTRRVAEDEELAGYVEAETPDTPEMVVRRVEREIDRLEERFTWAKVFKMATRRKSLVRWCLDRGRSVRRGARVRS